MKFKLTEHLNNIWYHASDKVFEKFQNNWQGIHLADSIKAAIAVMENRSVKKYNLYFVKTKAELKPLYIDLDPMSWGALDIARLFIAKINNTSIEGATGSNNKSGNNYKYNLSPDLVHINNLEESDLKFLNSINSNTEDNFKLISDFIIKKGFNCIIYPLAEDRNCKSKALIVFNPEDLEIFGYKLNQKLLEDFEEYNANPWEKNTDDCSIRALSLAYDIPYNSVKSELNKISAEFKTKFNELRVIESFIENHKYKNRLELETSNINTVESFIKHYKHGIYIVYCSNSIKQDTSNSYHLVTVINGKIYDTWDSATYYAITAWEINNNPNRLLKKVNS